MTLAPTDRIVLAPAVRLDGTHVVDDVRGVRYPANTTALELLSGDESLSCHAAALASRYGQPPGRVRRDVLRFAWSLNQALLVNVVSAGHVPQRAWSFVLLALRLLPTGSLPPSVARRHAIDTTTVARALVTVGAALAPRATALAVIVAVASLHVVVVAGSAREGAVQAALLGLAAAGALVAHEAAHAAALRGVPTAFITQGLSTYVLHRRLTGARSAVVSLAGPAVPALGAAAVVSLALARSSVLLALVACPLAGHGLAATVGGRDGRVACGL